MGYKEAIFIINVTTATIMLLFTFLLLTATRLHGKSRDMALILLGSTLPAYFYGILMGMGWDDVAAYIYPLSYCVNTMMMPLLWIFVRTNFATDYRFRPVEILHFMPTAICLTLSIIGLPLRYLNYTIFAVQIIVYFFMIFRYMRRMKQFVREHLSEMEWLQILWIPRFMALILVLFIIALMCHIISSSADEWLYQILNVIAMSYLVYEEMKMAQKHIANISSMQQTLAENVAEDFTSHDEAPTIPSNDISATEHEDLKQYAHKTCQWLEQTEAYINPNLSLRDVAKAVNISSNNLSKSINLILNKSFFDLINGYRVEKSKILLIEKKERGLTLETIAEQCGFNTHFTYCRAFKKYTGLSTQQWLNSNKAEVQDIKTCFGEDIRAR